MMKVWFKITCLALEKDNSLDNYLDLRKTKQKAFPCKPPHRILTAS